MNRATVRNNWAVTGRDYGSLSVVRCRTRRGVWNIGLGVVEHALILSLGTHEIWFTRRPDFWFERQG
jgi:hypothetical protein